MQRAALIIFCAFLLSLRCAAASGQAEKTGDALRLLIPVVAYGTTFYLDDSDGRNQFYKSFFTNLAITYTLKKTVSKTRPNGTDNESFPSGH